MMTSVGSDRSRGTRDKTQIQTHTQLQKPVQATAEQIRLAQMIYDKNDTDFEDKVKQLMEVTGKNQDESIVALHDCNGDVNRAINVLLEGNSDTTSWETVGKKKNLGTGKDSLLENKENREKRGDREASRGRGSSSRRGKGNRGKEFRAEENGVDVGPGDRLLERGRRGRGRGLGGRSRGRGGGRFSAQGMGTFNPADYTDSTTNDGYGTKSEMWESGQNDCDGTGRKILTEKIYASQNLQHFTPVISINFISLCAYLCFLGAWKNSMEDWVAEDWSEDLTETKVFTASTIGGMDNRITAGQSIDLATLLQKPSSTGTVTETNSYEAPQQANLTQSLVFTNSRHDDPIPSVEGNSNAVNSYSQSLSSVLGSGFGELGTTKMANSSGSQLLEQLKSSGLVPLAAQNNQQSNTPAWETKSTLQSTVLSQFDFKTQPEPSPVLSQLTQRQQQASVQPVLDSFSSQIKLQDPSPVESTVTKMIQQPPVSADNQMANVQQSQQKQVKPQKRKIPPSSKIPASAVEMPGSADVSGLNVQFGALEFGSEPSLPDFGTGGKETISQTQNHLFSNSVSDSLSQSLSISNTVQESTHSSSVISSSSLTTAQSTAVTPTYDQNSVHRIPYQNSLVTSPQKEPPLQNGYNGHNRTQQTFETSTCPPIKSESPPLPNVASLSSSVSAASSLLPSVSQHSAGLSSLNQTNELSSSALSQLSSSLSNHQSSSLSSASSLTSSTSHAHTSVDSSLQTSPTFSTASTSTPATTLSVNVSNSLHTANSLGLSVASVSVPTATTRATPLVSSGKAPPNLPQGVPPLLHNQYIVGPGGLLPAYPIYGYDDLQMLQSRLPMDYYGMAFPAPAATLAGRDGSLANNPYSGDLTKFGRGDTASPAPATTLAQPQQNQTQAHHTTQQAFLNPALPPGYSYTGLPYYTGVPGVPSTFQYGPAMFVPPASAKQHGVNMNTASTPFQQAGGYGQHGYGTGYDDLNQGGGAGDYSKGGYSGSTQAQTKSAGPGKGVSVTSTNAGVPDITGSVYNKAQSFDKQGFHAGTPAAFNLPSALAGTGPLNPAAAPGYAPAPFLHIVPAHQQPHSQLLHHHLQQDGQGGSGQRNQQSSIQQKSQANKPNYGSSPYWGN
ncbi:ubiquitin-associated protein 2a isoform X4 [Callorhinchus milii]|uniref:ubiquitin-associated protein 2a isoform X4 n=1 Tax=Callorhinchus milii TaxID=7868 RepID=UPI001C3FED04|nr:ubiquitin-associated protein 2a isoform X4 [Callorhinchus milii]